MDKGKSDWHLLGVLLAKRIQWHLVGVVATQCLLMLLELWTADLVKL